MTEQPEQRTSTVDHAVALVFNARPQWDPSLVRVIFLSHPEVDVTDLTIAALRLARDPNAYHPKGIAWRGAHWEGLDTRPTDQRTWTWCGVCGRPEPECLSVRFGGDDHEHEPTARPVKARR